jgi:hypothetical protein
MSVKSKWFERVIAGNEKVGKAATVEESTDKALEDPEWNVVAFPGPLTRFVIADIQETGRSGITITCVHASFDGVSFPLFVNDLDAVVGGKCLQSLQKRLPYKPWTDAYYSLQRTPLAQEAAGPHTSLLLDTGIA